MAGDQYVYSEGDAEWFSTFLARVEKQSKGYNGISLTAFATSTVCAIAAGSVVEIDGAVFHFASETSVSGSIATGQNYIICSVTGTSAEPYWSQTAASTWDTAKQGFYTAAERYVAGCASDGSTYNGKWLYLNQDSHSSPAFNVDLGGTAQENIATAYTCIEWSTINFDTHNYLTTGSGAKFTPLVAGKYIFTTQVRLYNTIGDDQIDVSIFKNGVETVTESDQATASVEYYKITTVLDANGTTDYFQVFAQNNTRATSDISGAKISTWWSGSKID